MGSHAHRNPSPGAAGTGEVLVRLVAYGVCHTGVDRVTTNSGCEITVEFPWHHHHR